MITTHTAARLRTIMTELGEIVEDLEAPARAAPAIQINRTLRLNPEHWFDVPQTKDLIVLHFTAGSTASGALSHWNGLTGQHVGTAYMIDLDGTVYETFDPRGWAYHLGIKSSHGDAHDRRSIGIEIVNVGPLRRAGDVMNWWAKNWTARYCGIDEVTRYRAAEYRGEVNWATYTGAQYDALVQLIPMLCREHHIPMAIPPPMLRQAAAPDGYFREFCGIAAHQNFRADKFDVGPAFEWDRLMIR